MGTDTTPRDVIANWLPITDRLAEDPHAVAERWADALLAALTEAGYVVMPRDRAEAAADECPEPDCWPITMAVAAASELLGFPEGWYEDPSVLERFVVIERGRAERLLTGGDDKLQPGDLDPLP